MTKFVLAGLIIALSICSLISCSAPTSDLIGIQLLAPSNGAIDCKVKPASFSWNPWPEATKYQLDLASDYEFKSMVVTSTTTTTGYTYSGTLNYSNIYFWRVRAVTVNGLPIASNWSDTFSFTTEPAP